MKLHLIKEKTIRDYIAEHSSSEPAFNNWLAKIKYSDWNEPADIKNTFSSADLLGKRSDRVVFDVGGNNHRLICRYMFGEKKVHLFIKWIGTHAKYDKLCKSGEQFTIEGF